VNSQCEQLTVSPPRFRLGFWIVNTHAISDPLCGVRVSPIAFNGIAAEPVLDTSGPAPFTSSVDSTGVATFGLDSCVFWNAYQFFYLIVAAAPVYFTADLLTTGGIVSRSNVIEFPCTTVVPVLSRSWGSLKLLYR